MCLFSVDLWRLDNYFSMCTVKLHGMILEIPENKLLVH